MSKHRVTPFEIVNSFKQHRSLIGQMVTREIISRFKGSVMGVLWPVITPIMMLGVYTFIFSVVFKARWHPGQIDENKVDFAIMLFVGMIIYGIFAECLNRAPSLVLGNPNYVKRVVFPLHIMPWIVMGHALFNAGVSLLVLLVFLIITNHTLSWTLLLLPLILLPLVGLCMGLIWFLSALGVYLRDVGQATGIMTTVLMFLSPVFYPVANMPQDFQNYLHLNPLTSVIEQAREVIVQGGVPSFGNLIRHIIMSGVVAYLGFIWFQKTRKGFADVI